MSFIFSLFKRLNSDGRNVKEKPTNLDKIRDETPFAIPSGKVVEFVQKQIVKTGDFPLFTDCETYLLNKQKIFYLNNIEYSVPAFLFWLQIFK